jgi:hypothetical protein
MKNSQSISYQALELKYHLKTIYPRIGETGLDLLVSSLTEYNPDMTTDEFLSWLEKQNKKTIFNIKKVPLNKLSSWFFDKNNNLQHNSGKFFSIEGIHVKTDSGTVKEWKQPIINQPEIGILCFLCQKHEGILYFLLQANIIIEVPEDIKIELSDNYCWLTLGQIKKLLSYNNIINMDTRTVLSCTQIKAI